MVSLLAFTISSTGAGLTTSLQEDEPPEQQVVENEDWRNYNDTRVFHAGRNNEGEGIYEGQYYQNLENVRDKNREEVNQIQEQFDFFYKTTRPVMKYSSTDDDERQGYGNKYSLMDIQHYEFLDLVSGALGNQNSSNSTIQSPPLRSGENYIEDAHVTISAVRGSGEFQTDNVIQGYRILPKFGGVYQFADFRVNVSEKSCDIVETNKSDKKICYNETVQEQTIKDHQLIISGKNDSERKKFGESYIGIAGYGKLKSYGEIAFRARAKANVTVKIIRTVYNETGYDEWELQEKNTTTVTEEVQLRDSVSGYRIGDIRIKQYVFNHPDKQTKQLALTWQTLNGTPIDDDIRERISPYLWQELTSESGGKIKNVWGVYSIGTEYQGYTNYKDRVEEFDGPIYPEVFITTRYRRVQNKLNHGRLVPGNRTLITKNDANIKHTNVTLQAANRSSISQNIYVLKTYSEIESATGITGNSIPVNTSYKTIKSSQLTATKVDNNTVEFKLMGSDGVPLTGEQIIVDGAYEQVVTIGENGTARVKVYEESVSAVYRGFVLPDTDKDARGVIVRDGEKHFYGGSEALVKTEQRIPLSSQIITTWNWAAAIIPLLIILGTFVAVAKFISN